MPKSPILGGFSTARSSNAADNRTVNLGLEVTETKDGKVPGFLFLQSGLDLIQTVGDGPIRGLLMLNATLYVVSGPGVYSISATGVVTLCGAVGDEDTPVSMFQNKKQLMIVDGVGAWLVPGGLPLTGGTLLNISSGGGLYQVNDTVTLLAASGDQTAYPIIRVTQVANNPVSQYRLVNPGTTYTSASGVATTNIQPQPGTGSGLTINITAASGSITTAVVGSGGANYNVGDTGIVNSGSRDAVYRVTAETAGVVTAFVLLNPGTSYAAAVVPTLSVPGIPANSGVGFTLNTTAAAGPITASAIANGGFGYVIGAAGLVSGGSGNATWLVLEVGASGTVTAFTIIQGGAIDTPTLSFSQKSTSGSGSGLVLTSPTFGSFVGLIPIEMPFPNPVKGGISDGFGVLVFLGLQYIAASDQLDLSTWNPLSFGIANQSPDNCVSLAVLHDQVYIPKEGNTEVWINQGLSPFPFQSLPSVHMENGILAPFSIAIADEELIWLARNDQGEGVFVKVSGYQIQYIGTQALSDKLLKYPNLGGCIAYVRQEGAHVYYVATFPEANVTWVYDKTSSSLLGYPIWLELAAFDNGNLNRHWGNAFTPWRRSGSFQQSSDAYDPLAVNIAAPAFLATTTGLTGLPTSFSNLVFSVWLNLSDADATGMVFGNQVSPGTPGMEITIQNDGTGTPQITVEARDSGGNLIVTAEYDYSTWSNWVNFLISIDSAGNKIQVYGNTIVAGNLVESHLTPTSLTWSSTNEIAPSATVPWSLEIIT